jgi:dihydroceramidase
MQLVDELAMIYTTCFMCFATFSYARSTSFSVVLGAGLLGLSWFITVRTPDRRILFSPTCVLTIVIVNHQARYYQTQDPQFHQDAYAILTALVVFSNMYIMERTVRPALKERQLRRKPASVIPPAHVIVKEMWLMVATGKVAHFRSWKE